ncbi:MAG TPA: DUF2231 domain-containing protein [Crenotrichaceae bacterium]|nr:DUF2231 domain-containing protein [Crenotrichaceae bacterium]
MLNSLFSPSFFVHSSDSFGGGHLLESLLVLLGTLVESGFPAFLQKAFPGIHALPNIHPLFVHFPIALFTTFLLLEIIAMMRRSDRIYHAASWTLYVGVVFAVTAILLGMQAARSVPHGGIIHSIIDQHEGYATTATAIAAILSLWRMVAREHLINLSPARWFHLLLAVLMVLFIFLTADLGGLMVFKFGVGVHG